jgi:hypothetical protein
MNLIERILFFRDIRAMFVSELMGVYLRRSFHSLNYIYLKMFTEFYLLMSIFVLTHMFIILANKFHDSFLNKSTIAITFVAALLRTPELELSPYETMIY